MQRRLEEDNNNEEKEKTVDESEDKVDIATNFFVEDQENMDTKELEQQIDNINVRVKKTNRASKEESKVIDNTFISIEDMEKTINEGEETKNAIIPGDTSLSRPHGKFTNV